MRDIIIALIVFGSVPFILARPNVGVLVWSWLGYMNPHRMAYGFAYNFPFSMVVAAATLVALMFSSEKKRIPWHAITVVWIMLVVWMNVTTIFSLNHDAAVSEWNRTMKIMLMVLITLMVMSSRERIHALVWIIALSLGFFGLKGGLFSIATGGQYRVWGPDYSFIQDNNTLALALVMTLPLMRYLQQTATKRYVRWGMIAAMGLTAISIVTSFSRGALLAGTVMAVFLAWNSRYRARMFLAILLFIPIMLSMMPQAWWDRMGTIQSYDQDASAMGRINAWYFAFNLAVDRPLVGGGFQAFSPELFHKYAPDPEDFHDAHSIYFEMLAEQGFVGLLLFLMLGSIAFFTAGRTVRLAGAEPSLQWARELAAMLQVSIVGYATGGAFLGLAYFDLFYHLVALVLLTRAAVARQLTETASSEPCLVPAGATIR